MSSQMSITAVCGCPIWDFLCVPALYDAEFRGPISRPPGFFPVPCGGHGPRKAGSGSPPGGHSPASHAGTRADLYATSLLHRFT
eukprot:1816516-Prymnesium_polylepis.1